MELDGAPLLPSQHRWRTLASLSLTTQKPTAPPPPLIYDHDSDTNADDEGGLPETVGNIIIYF